MTVKATPKPALSAVEDAPVADTGFVFDDVDVTPAVREPNPFDAVVASLVIGSSKGKAFTVPGNHDVVIKFSATGHKSKSYTNKALNKVRRQLTDAGSNAAVPVTVRWVLKDADGGNTRVEIRAIPKIVRDGDDDEE